MTRLVYELSYYDNDNIGHKLLAIALKDGFYRKFMNNSRNMTYMSSCISNKFLNLLNKKYIELDLMNHFKQLGYNFLVEIVLCDHYDMWFNKIEIVGTPSELTHYKMRYQ